MKSRPDEDGMFRASLELLFSACGDMPLPQQTEILDKAFDALPEEEFTVLDEATAYLEDERIGNLVSRP